MKIFNNKDRNFFKKLEIFLKKRTSESNYKIDQEVKKIINKVSLKGDKALFRLTKK